MKRPSSNTTGLAKMAHTTSARAISTVRSLVMRLTPFPSMVTGQLALGWDRWQVELVVRWWDW